MSRGIKDLRDLICVSRLTIKESDEEVNFSDDNSDKLSELISKSISPPSIATARALSPDSGFVTNGSPGTNSSARLTISGDSQDESVFVTLAKNDLKEDLQPGTARFKSQKKKKRKKSERLPLEPAKHDLPRPPALPPLQNNLMASFSSDDQAKAKSSADSSATLESSKKSRANFDDMMIYLDATIVANWLTRANAALQDIISFCNKGDNFVQFAHFWLSQFPDVQKRDIFRMEYDILLDEFTLAFAVGKENGNVVRRDILDICGAVFKEYPMKLVSVKGSHIFLNYLDILTSEKQDQYKKLLSDVRCSTANRQFAQWLLAMRSFALVNVWSSLINFYTNVSGNLQSNPIFDHWSSKENVHTRRMLQAIRLGYIEVIHYLITNDQVTPSHTDSHGRSLLFSAVMHNQLDVVRYLLRKFHTSININLAADTGNTPLHAASNSGNLSVVEALCESEDIDVNCQNYQCENAAPLHLAVMHGHTKIVECLLKHGADPTLKMGKTTVYDLAKDFEHQEIEQMLPHQ